MQVLRGSRCGLKLQCIFLLFLFILLYVAGSLYYIFTQNYLNEATILESDKCPVCFGTSLCEHFFSNNIKLDDPANKLHTFDFLTSKQLYFATLRNGADDRQCVLKRFSGSATSLALDDVICQDANMAPHCSVALAVAETKLVKDSTETKSFAKHLLGTAPMFVCPSTRLLARVYSNYRERTTVGEVSVREKIQLWTTAKINPEPILLQTFPATDGWPFPEYLGSCGRTFVASNAGIQLSKFYNASWNKRVDLAYRLIKMADHLTNNKDEFAIYLTDITYDCFVVGVDGNLLIVNLKNIVVVDKQAIKEAKPDGWEDVHESTFTDCSGQTFKTCHSFSETSLCSHVTSDHNYYVICRYLLSRHADEIDRSSGRTDGLLHDIPDAAKNDWDLEYLLTECVMPTRKRGRLQVVHKLIEALDALRQNTAA